MLADTRPTPAPRPGTRQPAGATRRSRLARTTAAVVAALAAIGVWVMWRVFVATTDGQRVEELAFNGALHGQGRLWRIAEPVLDVVSVAFIVAGIGAAILVAVLRRRWGLAVQVAVLVVGANLTTQVAKHALFDRPDLLPGWTGSNALPSGHTTAAASVAAALLLAAPRAWRPAVAVLGAAYTAATGVSTLVGQWHRPSDVVAAVLVVLAWGAAVCAFTPPTAADAPSSARDTLATPGSSVVAGLMLLGGAAAGIAAVATMAGLAGEEWAAPISPDITAYAAGALGVVGASSAAFGLLLLLRQATARPS